MLDHTARAGRWLDAVVREAVRMKRGAAVWHVIVAFIACFIWWVCVVGTLYGLWFILAYASIHVPTPWLVGLGVFAVQFGLFRFVRRKQPAQWEVERDLDGGVVVIPPDHTGAGNYAYNQDHDFSFKRVYVGIFFAAPIALDEAVRDWRDAKRLKQLDREPAARLAAILLDEQKKLPLAKLAEEWKGDDFVDALRTASKLPAFQLFGNEPQGIALSTSAIEELLAA